MYEQELKELLNKIREGNATDEEKAFLENWYLQYTEQDGAEYSLNERLEDADTIWAELEPVTHANQRKLLTRIAAAASILLILSFGAYFILRQDTSDEKWIAQNFKNDIAPGTNSATLTLGNGKTIVLNAKANGQLAVQGNIAVTKTANGQLTYQATAGAGDEVMENTLTTRRKQQYKVVLADGTGVWLNAGSSIKYPNRFNGKYREVTITGEAYFEVAHNAAKPFRVKSAGQLVEVLGTHFNVNAYADEPEIKTTLLEGSVKVSDNNAFEIIKPGEQVVLKDAQLSVDKVDLDETVAWKNGHFRFNKEKIESIMRKLSRWYDIDVQYEGPVSEEEYSGQLSRFRNISEVLKVLQYSKSVHFKVEGRRVTVLK